MSTASRRRLCIQLMTGAALALVTVVGWPLQTTAADPADALKRVEASESFRAIAHFPKDIRDSLLELCQHPELIAALAQARDFSRDSINALTEGFSETTQEAAQRLGQHPQAVKVLASNMEVTTLLGIIYSHHPDELRRSADRIHEELIAADQQALAHWSTLLDRDGQAVDELVAAADDFEREQYAWTQASSDESVPEQFGFYVGADYEPVFYALPAYWPVIYVLENADRYPSLANVLILLRQTYRVHAPLSYAVEDWWRFRSHYYDAAVLRADAQRPARLREMAQFEKQYAEAMQSQTRTLSREEFRQRHADEFRTLSPFQLTAGDSRRDQDRDRNQDRTVDRDDQKKTTAARDRDQRLAKARELIQQRAAAESAERKAGIDARRRLSTSQQAARATQNLRRVWGADPTPWRSGTISPGRGGGSRRR